MKKIIILSSALALLFTFGSCNKYPDGPKFTLLTKKARVVGEWDLSETLHSDGTVTYDYSDDIMELTEDEDAFYYSGNLTISGTWEFISNKEKLRIAYGNFVGTPRIMRLKDKELWLKYEDTGDVLKFENID